ncbi:hypothetical protein D3C87_1816250 [compost metagenome]
MWQAVGELQPLFSQHQLHLTAVRRGTLAGEEAFLFQTVEHAGHRTAVQGQVTTELGRGIDAELGHDDQHLELRGSDAVGFHVRVDDPVLEQRSAPEQETEMAIVEIVWREMFHLNTN